MYEPAPLYTELADAPEDGQAFWVPLKNRRIRAAVWEGGERGTVILFNGRTEYIEKYGRVIRALTERGFNVATLDWRGQGLSDRPLSDPLKGHVAGFDRYQRDVKALMKVPKVFSLRGPKVLICHSMGGCIGMRALLDETIKPKAVIMSAPMFGIYMKPVTNIAARVMVAMARRFSFEQTRAPAPKGDRPYVSWQPFDDNALTGDEEYYSWMKTHLAAEPGFGLGAPTLGWMGHAFDEMESIAAAPPVNIPTLMLLGDEEVVVEPEAIRAYDAKANACRLLEIEGARHEHFMETPEIQGLIWREIDRHLEAAGV